MTNTPNTSIVRENLLTRRGYTPYCGNIRCSTGMPRTRFNGSQFQCSCGWTSQYEAEFIEKYKQVKTALPPGDAK